MNILGRRAMRLILVVILVLSLSVSSYAASLSVSISPSNDASEKTRTVHDGYTKTVKGTIEYNGFFYTGYYKMDIPAAILSDEMVLSSSFSNPCFVYKSKGTLSGVKSWSFYKSFKSISNTSKSLKVSVIAQNPGKGKLYVGTGNSGDHDLDKKNIQLSLLSIKKNRKE